MNAWAAKVVVVVEWIVLKIALMDPLKYAELNSDLNCVTIKKVQRNDIKSKQKIQLNNDVWSQIPKCCHMPWDRSLYLKMVTFHRFRKQDWEHFLLPFRKCFEFYQDFYRSSVCKHADALVCQDLVSRQFKSIHNSSANRPIMGYFCASFLPSQCSDMTGFDSTILRGLTVFYPTNFFGEVVGRGGKKVHWGK